MPGGGLIFETGTQPGASLFGKVLVYVDTNEKMYIVDNGGNVETVISIGTPPSITGSRGGNAALASLLTELDTLGIITDNTTA